MQPTAFTITSKNGIQRVLTTAVDVKIPNENKAVRVGAIWDTGATGTAITEKVVNNLGLKPTGMAQVHTANGLVNQATYFVDIILPNGLRITDVVVTAVKDLNGDCDVLIGMDIISLGDFSITNHKGTTVMSFRIPSLHTIDYSVDITLSVMPKEKPKMSMPIGRNDLCPCGAGKKYKHCHGKA